VSESTRSYESNETLSPETIAIARLGGKLLDVKESLLAPRESGETIAREYARSRSENTTTPSTRGRRGSPSRTEIVTDVKIFAVLRAREQFVGRKNLNPCCEINDTERECEAS